MSEACLGLRLYAFREAWRLALCLLFLATKFLRLSLLSLTSNSDIVPSIYIGLVWKSLIYKRNIMITISTAYSLNLY